MNYIGTLKSLIFLCCCMGCSAIAKNTPLTLADNGYFAAQGIDFLVFNNWYNGEFSDAKISGIELIHHGIRTATNGDLRLNATPEQWDEVPTFIERKIDKKAGFVEVFLEYPGHHFKYSIKAHAQGDVLHITVFSDTAIPKSLEGKIGFNLEFLPSTYFEQLFLMDNRSGLFPLSPSGVKEQNDRVAPVALAAGQKLVLAPSNAEKRITIESSQATLQLYDGRAKAQNGWFVVRSLLPKNKQGELLHWRVKANTLPNWIRPPMIAYSQVGYHPSQNKVAVIELDKNAKSRGKISLLKIDADGHRQTVKTNKLQGWGQYKRYAYSTFDFSDVTEPGIYSIRFDQTETSPFRIDTNVYESVWFPTLDVFLPVQMDHVLVNEAYRVWHGASHLDDALQAPVNHQHFDLYAQGPTTDTPYQPGEHIPGLNIGGWYDAGDYDIRTQTQYSAVLALVAAWERFKPQRDTTTVAYEKRWVDLHVPDGKADILQQVEHGTLALIAQHRAVGHAIAGIIVPTIDQYTHLGDGLTMTDNQIYDAALDPLKATGLRSGVPDDRWAFTSRSSALNFGSMAALAAASRALATHNPALAKECLVAAEAAWLDESKNGPFLFRHGNTTGGPLLSEELTAAAELYITTQKALYKKRFMTLLPDAEKAFFRNAITIAKMAPYMVKGELEHLKTVVVAYRKQLAEDRKLNPFGVVITETGWAGNRTVVDQAIAHYYLWTVFPDLFDREDVLRGLNYLYGTHPYSNISFVSSVGTQSKRVAYGMNRADFSFIPGGVVPGVLMLKPDFPENKEDWPFLWGENEYVVNVGANYVFLAMAAQSLLTEAK